MPDEFVPVDTSYYTPYYRDVMAKGVLPVYCLNYVDKHRKELLKKYPNEDALFANFKIPQQMIDDIVARAKDEGVEPNPEQLAVSRAEIEAIMMGYITNDLYEDGNYIRALNPLNPVFVKALETLSKQ